jgi:hypothetical protein
VSVSKLAQIFPTGALDYIVDDSGKHNSLAGPYGPYRPILAVKKSENCDFCQGYATLGPYCRPMGGWGAEIFVLDLEQSNLKSHER